jgi:hypothetical protein
MTFWFVAKDRQTAYDDPDEQIGSFEEKVERSRVKIQLLIPLR